ncbi:MAG: hypothetical protein LBT38_02535, partial [Deltaproteobacteria bacterium]|nr:hypothetical protein [Deltaproteobacteria bacterium]
LHSLLERYAALDQILQRRSLSWAELEPASLKITLAKTTEDLERYKAFTAGWLAIVEGDPNLGFSLGKLDWRAEEGLLIEEREELNKRQFLLERYNLLTQKYPLLALGATNRLVQAGEVSQLAQNQADLADIKAIETSYATLIQRFPRFLAVLPNASALTSQEEFPQARERLKALVERFAALSQGYPGLDLANQPDINPVYVAENLDEKKKAAEDLKRLVERKNRLDKILSQFGLTSWANADWGVLAKRLAEDEAEIQRVRPLVDSYQAISPFWPELDKIPFRRLRQARELLAKTDKKLFALAQAKGLIQEPVLLKAKNAAGLDLFQRQQTLSRLVDLNNPLSPAELRELASTLWRAGTFKFLSLAYRKARSVYNSLSLVGPLTDAKAGAEILNRLMAFKEDLLTFARDPKVKELYGAYFAGLKTDFGLFNEALKFRDNLEAIFPGSAFEGFKNWLQAGRPEALNLLNAADYPDNNEDFTSFMAWFERLKARVADQKELAQNLKDPEFQAWLTEFPQHLARLRRLEDDIEGGQALLAFIEGFEPRQAASDYAALQSHIKNLSAQMAERTALIEDLKESDLLEINLEPPNDAQSTLKLAATVKARKELLDLGRAFSPEPSIIEYPAVLERENQLEAQAYDLGEVLAFFEARAEASSQDWAALTEKSNFLQDKTKALSQLLALVEDPGFAEFSGQLSQVEAQKSLITERHKAGEELANLLQAADFKVTKKDWRDRQSQWQNLKTEISQKKSACSSFEPMLAIFKSAVDLSYENVTNLAQELKFNQDFDLWLNSDPGLKNVPDNYLTLTSSDDPLATLKCLDFLKDQTAYWPLTRSILEKSSILSFSQELSGFLASRVQAYLDLARLTERTGLLLEIDEKNYLLAASFLREAASDRPGFLAQRALVNQKNRLGQLGFDWALEALKATGLGQIGLFVEASLSRILYRELYKRNSHKFDQYFGKTLGNARASFAENDRLAIKGSRERLRSLLAKPLSQFPVGLAKGPVSGYTEMGLLSHEMGKKTRYVSIRELTKRAGQTLKGLKPCWMMSPLAVATYLTPGQMIFDLCIIDEASQMTPENALGAMARSRQIMVVGDTNQLPPTNFFKKRLAELDDEEDETGLVEESILEAANKIFSPSRRLRWHYRSRHSSLIQFSNQWVYNNELMVFPSPDNQAMGVSLVKVDGLYKTGVNPIEAEAMVKAALKFMADFPDLSLGLVTLNIKQMELIRVKMDFELAQNAKARAYIARWSSRNEGLESFFIKNLESVQGDERDAIFIGTVYGPEKLGGPTANRFGPINGLAGKRRLNVLFTRSKRRIVTFSSMSPGDITLSESNEGATMLKNWLIYSQSQMDSTVRSTEKVSDPGFLGLLARVLEEAGCEVEPGVGLTQKIDLGVRHPKWGRGYILGLETDGPNWRETKSPRDRDRLKDEVLTGLGWKLYRAWSLNWLNTPQFEAESLTKAVQERLKELKRENPAGWVEPSITPPKAPLDLKALKRP